MRCTLHSWQVSTQHITHSHTWNVISVSASNILSTYTRKKQPSPWTVKLSWPWHKSEWKISWKEAVGEKSQRKFLRGGGARGREGKYGGIVWVEKLWGREVSKCLGNMSGGTSWEMAGSPCVAVICAILVNTQTHTHRKQTHTYEQLLTGYTPGSASWAQKHSTLGKNTF